MSVDTVSESDTVGNSSSSALGKPAIQLQRDEDYYIEDSFMVFQVESCLFRVPTYLLCKDSQLFGGMFRLPQPGEKTEGSCEDNPIILPSEFRSEDFRNLLEALYPTRATLQHSLTTSKWISILKLSTKWYFNKLRAFAIIELERMNELTSIQKVHLGRAYKVSSWIIVGLANFVRASTPMTDQEAVDLDLDYITTAYRIFRIRERIMLGSTVNASDAVKEAFKDELDAITFEEEALKEPGIEIPFQNGDSTVAKVEPASKPMIEETPEASFVFTGMSLTTPAASTSSFGSFSSPSRSLPPKKGRR